MPRLSLRSALKSSGSHGATLVEYAVLTGLIAITSIIAVSALGGKTSQTFEDVGVILSDTTTGAPSAGSSTGGEGGGTGDGSGDGSGSTEPPAPTPGEEYGSWLNQATCLVTTNGDDMVSEAMANGETCIWTRMGDDTIDADSGDHVIIADDGNDIIDGGNGSDTYVFARNDGHDVINGYGYSDNRVVLVDHLQDEAKFWPANDGRDLVVGTIGGSIVLRDYFANTGRMAQTFEFSDGSTLGISEIANKAAEDAKDLEHPLIHVLNTNVAFRHTVSEDGDYTIYKRNGSADSLQFVDAMIGNVHFYPTDDAEDLVMLTSDGNRITLRAQFQGNSYRIEDIIFTDATLSSWEDIHNKAFEDAKDLGRPRIASMNSNGTYYHTSFEDGSYEIIDLHGTDILIFTDLASGDVTFREDNYDLLILTGDGDTVRLNSYFNSSLRRIETIRFTDGDLYEADIRAATGQ